jgi:hypothetical protein
MVLSGLQDEPLCARQIHGLRVTRVRNGLLTRHELDDAAGVYRGAVYDESGMLIRDSVRDVDRNDNWRADVPDRIAKDDNVIGDYGRPGLETYLSQGVFAGHIFAGWGHLITESLASAWYGGQADMSTPVVFSVWGRVWASYMSRALEVLELAGWDRRPVVVSSGNLVTRNLDVPQPLFGIDSVLYDSRPIDPRMNGIYDLMIERALESSRSGDELIFLPRPTHHRRRLEMEDELEYRLVDSGFTSIRGWEIGVKAQIAAVSNARVIVGFSGSNLHNTVFAPRGALCVELEDERAHSRRSISGGMLQEPLCDLRSQRFSALPPTHASGGLATAQDACKEIAILMRDL